MKLYLVHCGFYDAEIGDGLFENHTNFFVAANNFEEARHQAKAIPLFQNKRMHVDGLQEIEAVNGFRINLVTDENLLGKTFIHNHKHRDLAPKPAESK